MQLNFQKHRNRFLTSHSASVIYVRQSGVCSVHAASQTNETIFQLHIMAVHRSGYPLITGFDKVQLNPGIIVIIIISSLELSGHLRECIW